FLGTLALIVGAALLHPALGLFVQILVLYFCLASKCLYDEGLSVKHLLDAGDVEAARRKIGLLVSRDVSSLDGPGIARASVETVAENFVDGVLSPLFYAAILGAPGAVAFKMASTLDSMVGYKNERYLYFGRASARLDDLLNWIPARLSVPVIALAARMLFGTGRQSLQTALREGAGHSSPNAAKPEAAFAGALGIKIGGPGIYHGRRLEKPWIGRNYAYPAALDIEKAGHLMLVATLLGMCGATGLHFFLVSFVGFCA
ncbi:MAG TPA: adenosylcobinamide-phosphate synthase CbiB, partial [Desulfosalsimonadaceae bacterium]|nr:adenosylcobinamide-phosphate synthase CbiB [Desulfosalsimonadaceae bacterium]